MKSKKLKSVVNVVTWVLIALVAVFAILNVVMKSSNKVLFVFGKANLFVVTESMEPLIPAQSYILIEKVNAEDVKKEDVITFYSKDPAIMGSLNTHRVTDIKTGADGKITFTTRGDHNNTTDAYSVGEDDLVGRYVCNLNVMTVIGRFFMSTGGLIAILILIIILAVSMVLPYAKKKGGKNDKNAEADKQKLIDEMIKAEIEKLKASDEKTDEKTASDADETPENTDNTASEN